MSTFYKNRGIIITETRKTQKTERKVMKWKQKLYEFITRQKAK